MSEYTPTTAKVRDSYAARHIPKGVRATEAKEEFDRWLAGVKAEARDEGFAAGVNHDLGDRENIPEQIQNPYRKEQS